jgi:hypothetical protein
MHSLLLLFLVPIFLISTVFLLFKGWDIVRGIFFAVVLAYILGTSGSRKTDMSILVAKLLLLLTGGLLLIHILMR